MLRRSKEVPRSGHYFLLAFTVSIYALTMVSFIAYESYYNIVWFHTAYVSNALGIILGAWVAIPRLVQLLNTSEEKISPIHYVEPTFAFLALLPFIFTFIIHCDQWYAAQPFVGQSIKLIIGSLLLMMGSVITGIFTASKAYARPHHQFKLNKPTVHFPFH